MDSFTGHQHERERCARPQRNPDAALDKNRVVILMLEADADGYIAQQSRSRGVNVFSALTRQELRFVRAIRRAHLRSALPFKSIWFGAWKKVAEHKDLFIVHGGGIIIPVCEYIRRHNNAARIVLWHWNPVSGDFDPSSVPTEVCEQWSFDPHDARRYELAHNTQFYFSGIDLPEAEVEFDALFVGTDKGRIEDLVDLERHMIMIGLKPLFKIVASRRKDPKYADRYVSALPYETVLDLIARSRAIVDVVQDGQDGLTLRPLEALFFSKKLITSNRSIKELDIFNPRNIFILGDDDMHQLPEFIRSPFEPIDRRVLDRYDFDSWLLRFFEGC